MLLAWEEPDRLHRGLTGARFNATMLSAVRRRGWAQSVGEREPGVASVSAPVRGSSGKVIAAISISGPIERMGYEMIFNSATQMTLRVGYLFPGEHEQSYLTYNCTYEVRDKKLYITYVQENPELDAFWTNPDNEEIATLARQRLHAVDRKSVV